MWDAGITTAVALVLLCDSWLFQTMLVAPCVSVIMRGGVLSGMQSLKMHLPLE